MKKMILSVVFFSGTLLLAKAQDKMNFQSWDGNNNGSIDKNEFMMNAKKFDKWDDNGDNRLSADEFQKAFFKLYDADGDDNISESEFQQMTVNTQANISINALDKNGDMNISKDEFIANVNNAFKPWDTNNDNYISKNEFYDKVYNWWDSDKSGTISSTEFDRIKSAMDKSFWDNIF